MNQEAAKSDYITEAPSPATLTDLQCLTALNKGDDEALVELYGRYSKGVFNYILRLIGDVEASEDILQEVFVAVWQGARTFRRRSSVKTWIYRIAHNQTVSWLRRQKRIDAVKDTSIDSPPDPEESLEVNWRANEVREAIEQLSPAHRATVELVFAQGLSYAEIGEILGCPVGTVKSRISNATRQLSRILKGSME